MDKDEYIRFKNQKLAQSHRKSSESGRRGELCQLASAIFSLVTNCPASEHVENLHSILASTKNVIEEVLSRDGPSVHRAFPGEHPQIQGFSSPPQAERGAPSAVADVVTGNALPGAQVASTDTAISLAADADGGGGDVIPLCN